MGVIDGPTWLLEPGSHYEELTALQSSHHGQNFGEDETNERF